MKFSRLKVSIATEMINPLLMAHNTDNTGKSNLQYRGTSSDNIEDIAEQFNKCCRSHEECFVVDKSTLPLRVLDVSNPVMPSLHESCDTKDRYVALSYCWGSADFIRTTSQNLEQHKAGIKVEKMPVIFNEAIMVTRALGIRYL